QKRGDPLLNESRDTLDFSAQYHFHVGERHEFTTGLDYRVSSDHHRNSFTVSLLPNERTVDQISGFIQDNINLIEDRLTLTVGTKLEVNDFTGFEYQPSARIAWMFNENQTVWGAVSRAV